jgi:alpha-glucosidase
VEIKMLRKAIKILNICQLVWLILLAFSITAHAAWQDVGNVVRVTEQRANRIVLQTSSGALAEVSFFDLDAVRVRIAPVGRFELNPSYAIENKDRKTPVVKVIQTSGEIILTNYFGAKIIINRKPFTITVLDADGSVVVSDDAARAAMFDRESGEIRATKLRRGAFETYYGFGEKALPFSRDGQVLSNWNTDTYRYTAGTDPLYQSIPFFIALAGGKAYGLFFHNTFRTGFDMGKTSPEKYTLTAAGGELDYFIFTGGKERTPAKILEDYTNLTGRMPLPPLWALGYQQSRFSYFPESRVREITGEFRRRKIPADAVYIDIDFMDGFRIFTWDKEKFPNPQQLNEDLAKIGFRSIVIVNPAVKRDTQFSVYQEGKANGFFCQTRRRQRV